MTDAAALPPEINTGLVHGGAGPAPLEQAALAFAAAAIQDQANAAQLTAILNAVRSQWVGQTAELAEAQLTPLIEWFQSLAVNGTATQAQIELAASSVAAAIAEAPVPPDVATNRTTWGVLNATNFFGVNTPAINVQDARYIEMWIRAAFARATSDVETATATGALVPWTPPTIPVNPGMVGTPTAHVMTASFRIPQAGLDNLVKLANEASLDGLAVEAAAGDVGHTAATSRPNSALVASAADQRGGQAEQNNPLDKASELGGQQAGQFGSQVSGMLGSVGQLPQAVQGAAQPLQQVASAPMQMGGQFGSVLQPLLQSSNFGSPALGGAESSIGSGMFATGGGPLAAALTRPAGFAGGGGAGGGLLSGGGSSGSGLRLPASALSGGANPASASGLGAPGTGATPGGSGMYGAPMHGRTENAAGSENKYASTTRLGPQEVGDEMAS